MAYAGTMGHRRRQQRQRLARPPDRVALGMAAAGLAGAPIAYMLWPAADGRSRPTRPSLPITIGGVAFNVPPAAIRFKVQRRAGRAAARRPHLRVAVARRRPTSASSRCRPTPPDVTDRLFVTIAASDSTLSPVERLKTIYPRYAGRGPDRRTGRAQPCKAFATARPIRARI